MILKQYQRMPNLCDCWATRFVIFLHPASMVREGTHVENFQVFYKNWNIPEFSYLVKLTNVSTNFCCTYQFNGFHWIYWVQRWAENSFAEFYIGEVKYKKSFGVAHFPLKIYVVYWTFLNVWQNCFPVIFAKFLITPFV